MKKLLSKVWKKEEGFSLIELIIVIAILAIIAIIAVPNLLGNIKKANQATDIANAKLIADAISVTIANNPELEGVAIEAAAGIPQEFTTAVVGGTISADEVLIINGAIANLNGSIPLIKNKDNGVPKDEMFVHLSTDGKIRVYGTGATGVADTAKVLFPQ